LGERKKWDNARKKMDRREKELPGAGPMIENLWISWFLGAI
jgi:hypothetical protein